MDTDKIRERVAELLLAEMRADAPLAWYYISQANESGFPGGYLIKARGPTEAHRLFHGLDFFARDVGAETLTVGPMPEEAMARVPEGMWWRWLTRDEAIHPGS